MISRYNLLKNDICVAFNQGVIVQVYKVIKNLLTKRALGSIIIKLSDDADKCFTETSIEAQGTQSLELFRGWRLFPTVCNVNYEA